jgi:hypothetical protein
MSGSLLIEGAKRVAAERAAAAERLVGAAVTGAGAGVEAAERAAAAERATKQVGPPKFIPAVHPGEFQWISPKNYKVLNNALTSQYTLDEIKRNNNIIKSTNYKQFLERVIFSCYIDILLTYIGEVSKKLDEEGYKMFLMGGLAVRSYNTAQYTSDIDLKIFEKKLLDPDPKKDLYGIHIYGTPTDSKIIFNLVSTLLTPYLDVINITSNIVMQQYIRDILNPILTNLDDSTHSKVIGFIREFKNTFEHIMSGAGAGASGAGASGAGASGAGAGASGAGTKTYPIITLKIKISDKNPEVLKILAYVRGDKTTTTWYPEIGHAIPVKIGDITLYNNIDMNFQTMLDAINDGSNLIPSSKINLGYRKSRRKTRGYIYVPTEEYLLKERAYLINYYTYMTNEKMEEDNITLKDKERYIEKFKKSLSILTTHPPLPRVFIGGKDKYKRNHKRRTRNHKRRTRNKRRKLRTRSVRRVRKTRNKHKSRRKRNRNRKTRK